jgi:beta-galactosidase
VARAIAANGPDLLAAEPARAQVAVLFNRLSYMVGGAESSLSKLGNALRDSAMGVHRACAEQQIPMDFVHPQDVLHDKLSQYKILFLPFPVMLSKSVAEGVARFIRSGGTVVAEARLAWNDERGFSSDEIPGMGLAAVFGAREKVIRPVEKPELILEPNTGLDGWAAGKRVTAEAFEEELEPASPAGGPLPGCRVLARFADGPPPVGAAPQTELIKGNGVAGTGGPQAGPPAIVESTYGKGKAILVGTFLALAYERQHNDAAKQVLLALGLRSPSPAWEPSRWKSAAW